MNLKVGVARIGYFNDLAAAFADGDSPEVHRCRTEGEKLAYALQAHGLALGFGLDVEDGLARTGFLGRETQPHGGTGLRLNEDRVLFEIEFNALVRGHGDLRHARLAALVPQQQMLACSLADGYAAEVNVAIDKLDARRADLAATREGNGHLGSL